MLSVPAGYFVLVKFTAVMKMEYQWPKYQI